MAVFRILKAEGKAPVVIKKGFSWPAALIGPIWACYKRFWPAAIALPVVTIGMRFLVRLATELGLSVTLANWCWRVFSVTLMVLVGRYANLALTSYLVAKGYKVTEYIDANSLDEARDIANGVKPTDRPAAEPIR